MPNHLHALIGFSNSGKNINRIVGNGKRFMAYEIVKRLQAQGEKDLLLTLRITLKQSEEPITNFMMFGNYHSLVTVSTL